MKAKVLSAAGGIGLGVERVVSLFDTLAVVLQAPAGFEPDRNTKLKVAQGEVGCTVPGNAWIAIPGGREAAPAKVRRGKAALTAQSGVSEMQRFLAPVSREAAARFDLDAPVEISLDASAPGEGVALRASGVAPADLAGGLNVALAQILQASEQEGVAAILGASIAIKPLEIPSRFWLEHLVIAGTGLVAIGWMANLADKIVHVVSEDLQTWLLNSSFKPISRPDVHAHLRNENALTSASDEHGFTFVMPKPAGEHQNLYFVEVSDDGRNVTFHGPLEARAQRDEALALDIVRKAFGDIRSLDAEQLEHSYRPLLSTEKGEMQAQVFDFGPPLPRDRPVSSIIIPFYGDAFFLNCVHYLQRVLDDRFELVLVVDDPRIWGEIYNNLAVRSKGLRVPTRLLRNMANYGYGGANNIAVSLSRGDVLFLMNSDILVKDPRGLVSAAEAIRQRRRASKPELVAGFSLLYEDNTIQHIGMEFPRSSLMGDMYIADHPMKGLPFDFYEGETVRKAQAVTAALMALSKDLFEKLGGFDLRYERGDFEDADLCLRAKALGAEIEVHVHPGLYHLERQSIPAMAGSDVRSMVTYMNCAEFNRRWEASLSKPRRVFKFGAPQATPAQAARR